MKSYLARTRMSWQLFGFEPFFLLIALRQLGQLDFSTYEEFRTLEFTIGGQKHLTHTAFNQGRTFFGFKASGVLAFFDEICSWESIIRNKKTKTGSFKANCPSGAKVDGKFTFQGNYQATWVRLG